MTESIDKKEKVLVNMGSRERSLIYAYVLSNGDAKDLKARLGIDLSILVIGEGARGKITTWYQPDELSSVTEVVVEKVKADPSPDPSFYEEIRQEFYEKWNKLLSYVKKEKTIATFREAYAVYELYYKWWSANSYMLDASKAADEIKTEYQKWRVENERYTEEVDKLFVDFIVSRFPEYKDIARIITPHEMLLLEHGPFSVEEMRKIEGLKDGYVLCKEHVHPISYLDELLRIEAIVLDKEEPDQVHDSLQGIIACPGQITGKARLVRYKEQLAELQEGEILIAEATTPDYVMAIKKAGAIVTDEGSMMSHAAITCRELGKICIVGTAWATKTFKTGEMVEVIAVSDSADGNVGGGASMNKGTIKRIK